MSTLKEHQAILLELLIEFDRVCQKHNIKYILFAGSALGAVRHQGFIPWDDDLDVALLREDYERLMKLDPDEWNKTYYMQCEYSDHWPIHFSKLRKNNTTCLEKYHPKDNETHHCRRCDPDCCHGCCALHSGSCDPGDPGRQT